MTLILASSIDGVPGTAQVTDGWASKFYRTVCQSHVVYSANVVVARNRVAQHVLDHYPKATHVLWWDTDMLVHDHMGLIEAMLMTKHDVIGASYPRKRKPRSEVGVTFTGDVPHDGLNPMKAIGFGFTITTVRALRILGEHPSTLTYTDRLEDGRRIRTRDLFGLQYVDTENDRIGCRIDGESELVSEDYSFCARWRLHCDGEVWLIKQLGISIQHVGEHAY